MIIHPSLILTKQIFLFLISRPALCQSQLQVHLPCHKDNMHLSRHILAWILQAAEAGRGLGTTSSAPNLPGLAPLQRPPLGQGLPQPSAPGGATSSPRFANQTRSSQAAGRSSKEPGNAPGMASPLGDFVAPEHAPPPL